MRECPRTPSDTAKVRRNRDQAPLSSPMRIATKATSSMAKNKAKESTSGRMVRCMRECLKTGRSRARVGSIYSGKFKCANGDVY